MLIHPAALSQTQDVCGSTDLRVPSFHQPVGRVSWSITDTSADCTATLISPSCMISAGHCFGALNFIEFNVPSSSSDGTINHSFPWDQYSVSEVIDYDDNARGDRNSGDDWSVFKMKPNEVSGSLPGSVQGFLSVSYDNPFLLQDKRVRVSGYGNAAAELNGTQQTSTGVYESDPDFPNLPVTYLDAYITDHNSGSAIVLQSTNEIIGIINDSGCDNTLPAQGPRLSSGGTIWGNFKLQAAIQKCLSTENQGTSP